MEDPKKLEEGFGYQKKNTSEENIDITSHQVNKIATNRVDNNNQDLASNANQQNKLGQTLQMEEEEEQLSIKKNKRVATLDAFRGLTIVVQDLTYIY